MVKNKKILITGGAGYIGSILTRLLLEKGYSIRILDKMLWGEESLIEIISHPKLEIIKGDITNHAIFSEIMQGINAIIHLAAIVGDPACKKEPELATAVNLIASKVLFETAKFNKVQKFIFASTCSNYGKMPDPNMYVNETSPLKPVSLYAELKVAFEECLLNSLSNGIIPTSLRFATVYGISPRMRFDLTVNEFVRDIFFGKELVVFGEKFWRPYCHVSDAARACLSVLEAPSQKVNRRVFNVGDTAENYQKVLLIKEIVKSLPNANVKYVHKTEDPRDYKVDFSRIKKELGFKVTKRIPDGIKEIISALERGLWRDPYDHKYQNT